MNRRAIGLRVACTLTAVVALGLAALLTMPRSHRPRAGASTFRIETRLDQRP
jgi:hypothetical protein